jgi:hypothetical protein
VPVITDAPGERRPPAPRQPRDIISLVRGSSSWNGRVLIAAWVLSVVFLSAPVADALLFGPHDHVATAGEYGLAQNASAAVPAAGAHHCELSVSPAGAVAVLDLPAPATFISDVGEPPMLAAGHTPLVPLAPPRA